MLLAAGDIADCELEGAALTAEILAEYPDATIAALGDLAYPTATAERFDACYDPTWGQFVDRTRPALGNHDIDADLARPYYETFGDAAGTPGEGWYSYELGEWHVVVLNSNCDRIGCGEGSAQHQWLVADLAASDADLHAGVLSPPAVHLRPARGRPTHRRLLDRPGRCWRGARPRRARPPLRALHAHGARWHRRPTRAAPGECSGFPSHPTRTLVVPKRWTVLAPITSRGMPRLTKLPGRGARSRCSVAAVRT